MTFGYFGKVLVADLSSGNLEEKAIPDQTYKDFLGGYGLGVKLIYDWTKKGFDPLGPDAIVGIMPGLITGTVAPFSGRYMVCGKSPLTGGWGDANSGGFFGPAIKRAGFDGIFLKGVSQTPKYILISDNELALKNAGDLWGLDAVETDLKLQKEYGHSIKVAAIGQAGEKLSLISGLVNDKGRIAARSGLGAVIGSKKLKAIAISKKGNVEVKDKEKLVEITKQYNNYLNKKPNLIVKMVTKSVPKFATLLRWAKMPLAGPTKMVLDIYKTYGTTVANSLSAELGDSPVKNWDGIGYIDFPQERARKIGGQEMLKYKKRSYGCATCPVQCGAILSIPELGPQFEEIHRPEYETSCMLGTLSLQDDLMTLFKVSEMCNRAGIDSISTGSSVAFAIECFEKGILTLKDTDGLELRWGDSSVVLHLVEKIIKREGIGDILADGVKRAAERIGKGSEKFAIHAGGQDLPAHDPRFTRSLAMSYTTDPTPGRHTAASIDFAEIGPIGDYLPGLTIPKGHKKDMRKNAEAQRLVVGLTETFSSLGFCMFSTIFGSFPMLEILEATTGWKLSTEEVISTGLRIQMQRLVFSLREGVNPYNVTLPGRAWGEVPADKGPLKGVTVDYKQMNKLYYEVMNWDINTGMPSQTSLEAVGLGALYKDIKT